MRPTTLIAAGVLALLPATVVSSAAEAKKKLDPAPTYAVSGTITVTNVIRLTCEVPGTRGSTTSTLTTTRESSISGRGTPGSSAKKTKSPGSGSIRVTMRRKTGSDETVQGTDLIRPSHVDGSWQTAGANDGAFGSLVLINEGRLVVDLLASVGRRERTGTVRPAPGTAAAVTFDGAGQTVDLKEHRSGCWEETSTTTTSGTLRVSRL